MRVGLTGNIGSGKSTVCKVFNALGIPAFHADDEARKYYSTEKGIEAVIEKFGKGVLEEGSINFKKIAAIVFHDKEKLEWLNNQIHPFVRQKFEDWETKHPDATYLIYEAAILYETGRYNDMDLMITVSAPEDLRHQRIIERDKVSLEDARAREKNQWEQSKKEELADFIIFNDEKQLVVPQVIRIHNRILQMVRDKR